MFYTKSVTKLGDLTVCIYSCPKCHNLDTRTVKYMPCVSTGSRVQTNLFQRLVREKLEILYINVRVKGVP